MAAAVDGSEGDDVERARVIEGRAANPSAADELAVDEPLAAKYHLRLGDHVDLVSYTPAQFRAIATAQGKGPPAGSERSARAAAHCRDPAATTRSRR